MCSFAQELYLHHAMAPLDSSIRVGSPSVVVCLAPTEGLPTHSVSSQSPPVPLRSRNVTSSMLHNEVLDQALWVGWLLSHSLCGRGQDAGSEQRRHATCTWTHSWECPDLGHVLGWKEQLFLIFPLLIHCDRFLQLSLSLSWCAVPSQALPPMMLLHGGRCTLQQRKPIAHGWDAASAIVPPGPTSC